jgi:hypothetical protein
LLVRARELGIGERIKGHDVVDMDTKAGGET